MAPPGNNHFQELREVYYIIIIIIIMLAKYKQTLIPSHMHLLYMYTQP